MLVVRRRSFSRRYDGSQRIPHHRHSGFQLILLLGEWSKGRKLYGHMYDDIVKLKYLHQRYTNYLRWLRWKG